MDDIVKIKDLVFKYDDSLIFNRFNLGIKRNSFITITGPNGCGKTTLVKILGGLEKFDGYINIDGICLNKDNIFDIRMKTGYVLADDDIFVGETVVDEMAFILENLCYSKDDIEKEINRVVKLLGIKSILNNNPNDLSEDNKILVKLASSLVLRPSVLILDNVFDCFDDKEFLFQKLLQLKNTTIINFTSDLSACFNSDEIVIIKDGIVALKGNFESIIDNEDVLLDCGLEFPFMVDLSKKLQFYDLIGDIYLDMDEMVAELWK